MEEVCRIHLRPGSNQRHPVKEMLAAFFHLNHIVPGICAGLRTVEGNHCEVQQIMEDPGS